MIENEILDSGMMNLDEPKLFSEVEWWEKKRIMYNLILIGVEVLIMFYFWEGTMRFGIRNSIFQSFLYTIVANMFFSCGWGFEILVRYYFNINGFSQVLRVVFLVSGIIFSILLTGYLYVATLSYFSLPFFF